MTFENIQDQLNVYNQLQLGDIVGDTKRIVIACTKLTERIPNDSYATWIALCVKDTEEHPYAVWHVVARPEGFSAGNGDYCSSIDRAITIYKNRGGKLS